MPPNDAALFERIWSALEGAPAAASLELAGTPGLPSVYDVGAFATATIAAATAAIAVVRAVRTGRALRAVVVDRGHAATAFRCERYLSAQGWTLPPVWDPVAGDYRANDGWIRLHTNYRHHREAVLRVLGAAESRDAVAHAARSWGAEDLESAVVDAGGCAARLRTAAQWAAHPQGAAVSREPLFALTTRPAAPSLPEAPDTAAPLAGIRVLDLTRVMAGPVCTRLLAAYGADVLRLDPPGFEEVGALLPEMTAGKRRAFLDLRDARGRAVFEQLVAGAHVMVHGYRSDALDRLGFDPARRRELNPSLIDVSHDAYGWTGPWARRRGFDSLVQMSVGIAEAGRQAARADGPVPLPAQALDHGSATCWPPRCVVPSFDSRSIDAPARCVYRSPGRPSSSSISATPAPSLAPTCPPARSTAGARRWPRRGARIRRVRCPGQIDGVAPRWTIPPGPLGVDAPAWS